MKWSDEYETGIERIDEQHKMLFRMAADYGAALDYGKGDRTYAELLKSIAVYCRAHFAFEEDCMEQYRCPVANQNHEAHAKFVETLSEFQHRYDEKGYDPVDARQLVDTIEQWLVNHICCIDVRLRSCVQGSHQ